MDNSNIIEHESFGRISISRISCSGGGIGFFGSELKQNNYISLEIRPGSVERNLSRDWFSDNGSPLIKVRMSTLQFSELITNLNGSGSNCTVEHVAGKNMAPLLEISDRKTLIQEEFSEKMELFNKKILEEKNKISEIIKKKNLKNSDIQDIQNYLNYISIEITKNIPYFAKTFQENTEVVVSEAKMEIENYYDNKIKSFGLEKFEDLKNNLSQTKNDLIIENE